MMSLIGVLITAIGVTISSLNNERAKKHDYQKEGALAGRIEGRLDHIDKGVASIQHVVTAMQTDLKATSERLVRVEEAAKLATALSPARAVVAGMVA